MAEEGIDSEWSFQITLVRHGETAENRTGILQGQLDTILNDEGKRQVKLVSQRLKSEYFTRVYSSDLDRALKTAEGICLGSRFCQGTKICLDPLLRERLYGVAEGKPVSRLKTLREQGITIADSETLQCIEKRATSFFEKLLKEVSEEMRSEDEGVPAHILVVSHGGWIRSLVRHFIQKFHCQLPVCKVPRRSCPNTGISIFKLTLNNHQVKHIECLLFHDKSHLK